MNWGYEVDFLVHLLSWHQMQNERELGEALKQVKNEHTGA
jgi:hypothetical protein